MAATPASAARMFKQQVYVDVPSSPYTISRRPSLTKSAPLHALTSRLKENTPLRPSNGGMPRSASDIPMLKRKISERDIAASAIPSPKKLKVTDAPILQEPTTTSNACPEFPNGFIYCHQCSQKRDTSASIICTSTSTTKSKGVEKRCNAKYCGTCLKRRYGEDASDIKSQGVDRSQKVGHTRYTFKCPKCRDICNCSKCRKSKGLEPTGSFSLRKNAGSSVPEAAVLPNTKSAAQVIRKESKMKVEVFISTTPSKSSMTKPAVPAAVKPAVQKKPKQQTQTLPVLKWIAVPTDLDLKEAKSRFQIREFILRFASVMEPIIPKAQLAELDDVGCGSRGQGNDEEDMAPWVSEACVRSMVLGLLGLLADKDDENTEKSVKAAIRDIRATGNNLSKIWPILACMREAIDSSSESTAILSFPDPLPPPASATIYNTRITRSARDSNGSWPLIVIPHPAQMIPVIEALIEMAFDTDRIREELDSSVKDAKEMMRGVKECIKAENERWEAERKVLEAVLKPEEKEKEAEKKVKTKTPTEIKFRREAHKRRVQNLENVLKLILPGFAPRFAPLGTDSGGRVFWALSPGINERKTALDFITSATAGSIETKKLRQRGRALADDEDRSAIKEWSWFVVVWGNKFGGGPKHVEGKGKGKAADVDDDDEDVEQWWGFYEPGDIRKVADWIRIDAGIDLDGDADGNKPLASLVRGLNEYAALLEWRLKEDRYESLNAGAGVGAGAGADKGT